MGPSNDYSDGQPRWYGGDGGDGGYRVPEPRYAEQRADPRADPRVDPRADPLEGSFPGFQPARGPAETAADNSPYTAPYGDPLLASMPAAAPVPMAPPPLPTAGDPTATAERPRSLDVPTGLIPPMPEAPPSAGSADPTMAVPVPPRFHAEPINRAALRRPAGPAAPVGDGIYRTRRPALAIALAAVVVLFEVPALLLLVEGAFGDVVSASAIVAGTFLALGLPATGFGGYAVITGAARLPEQGPLHAWLRLPLAYLTFGLLLFLAAALAAA